MVSERVTLLLLILLITKLILDSFIMDLLQNIMLIYQLAYFGYLSLVAYVKSFLRFLDLITCDNDYLCYTALTSLKARDSCLWYLDSSCSRHMTSNKGLFKTLFEGKIGSTA